MSKSKSQIVYDYIEAKIMLGEYKPGEKIPSEAKLCHELKVSRVSVRSGIDRLISIGLLHKQKYGGTYVSKNSDGNYLKALTPTFIHHIDYLEMLELRQALDALSIELCIKNINDEVISELKSLIAEMETFKEKEDFFELDKKFHLTISTYSKNKLLHNINEIMWEVLEKSNRRQYHSIGNEERIIEHTRILNAIIDKDFALARLYSIRHLARTINDLKKRLCDVNSEL